MKEDGYSRGMPKYMSYKDLVKKAGVEMGQLDIKNQDSLIPTELVMMALL